MMVIVVIVMLLLWHLVRREEFNGFMELYDVPVGNVGRRVIYL